MRNTTRCAKQEKKSRNAFKNIWEYVLLVLNMVVNVDNLF